MPPRTTPSKPKRVVVAINPSASFGKSRDVGPALVQTLRASGHEVVSLQEPDWESLAASARAAVARRPDALVVVGGDGMVHLGANVLAGKRVPLGIVPAGTGNDMARSLGIPYESAEAGIRAFGEALGRDPRTIDAAKVRWTDPDGAPQERWVACAMSAGFDALVNERANGMRHPKGPSRYTVAILIELARLRKVHYRLTLDDRVIETDASLVSIGNGVSLGGGMKVTPNAVLDDGLLDVMIVDPVSRLTFLRLFPKVFSGEHVGLPIVRMERARRLRIEADGIVVYGDGERLGPTPVDVELVPGALRVLV
ncbi:diacylglycerol kinase family protein [Pseudolysinimonas sp.]|uniref:diacylglycerol kinase family protein n=1 Tax=Pseudolysinimonas sp. TaxID=2680009 RepID=UPI003F7F7099